MSRKIIILLVVLLFVLAGIVYGVVWFRNHGFSAREQPTRLEAYLARHARRIATPAGAKSLQNPHPKTEESLAEAREHFVAHCSICHGIDGRGQTTIGRNLYPKTPDMRDAETQQLTDGELFYIITNGVRFTGMPAWGDEDSPESIWALVTFIRRLPQLSPEELKRMKEMAEGEAASSQIEPGSPKQKKPKPHSHEPGAKPHKH
jgi:mono/diheme cytochrome c family protein